MIRNKNLALWLSEHKEEYNLILETCNNELSIKKVKSTLKYWLFD